MPITALTGAGKPVVQTVDNAVGPTNISTGVTVVQLTTALTAPRTFNLPSPSAYAKGATLTFTDFTGLLSATFYATLYAGSATINGGSSLVVSTPYASPILVSDGVSKWTLDIRGIARGGTGATTAAAALVNLGLGTGDTLALKGLTLGTSGNLFGGTNLIEQRNLTNPQTFLVYNGVTADGSSYDRGFFRFFNNKLEIGAERAGSPYTTARDVQLMRNGAVQLLLASGGLTANTHLIFNTHNAYDIGATGGVSCPRNIYVGTEIITPKITLSAGNLSSLGIAFGTQARLVSNGDGILLFGNSGITAFDKFQLGGTLDTHPAIARDGAGIKFTGAAAGLTSWIKVPPVAVASLPAAATAGVGARSFVNDALTPVFGSAVTGGGAVPVPVYSTGSAWNVG